MNASAADRADSLLQLASGFLVVLPAADRQTALVPLAGAGTDTEPAGPSTVLSWNGWLNSTVPADTGHTVSHGPDGCLKAKLPTFVQRRQIYRA
jgi:hypothetical protein